MEDKPLTEKQAFFAKNVKQFKFRMRPNNKKLKFNHPDLVGTCNEIDEDKSNYIALGWIRNENGAKVMDVVIYRERDQKAAQQAYRDGIDPSVVIVQKNDSFKLQDEDDLPL